MQEVSSKFKYTIELGTSATKSTLKIKKSRKDKITHILVIAFIFIMAGMMIWDITRGASFVIDLIILVVLVAVEIFSLIMPIIIIHTQKKFLKQLNLAGIDYTETKILKDKCTETYYKDGKIVMQNVCDITKLVGYEIRDKYIFLVFANFACAIFEIATLNVSVEEFTKVVDSVILKNKSTKSIKV